MSTGDLDLLEILCHSISSSLFLALIFLKSTSEYTRAVLRMLRRWLEYNFVHGRLVTGIAHCVEGIHQPASQADTYQLSRLFCFHASKSVSHAINDETAYLSLKRTESQGDVWIVGDAPGFPRGRRSYEIHLPVYKPHANRSANPLAVAAKTGQ